MSASRKIPSQIRELRSEPDPQEPSFSYEEKLNGELFDESPFLRKEDEFHRILAQTSHRIRSSNTSGSFASYNSERSSGGGGIGGLSQETESKPSFRSNHLPTSSPHLGLASQQPLESNTSTYSHQTPGDVRRVGSSMSLDSTSSTRDERKRKEKDRAKERFHKLESLTSDFEMGRIVDINDQDDTNNTDYDGEIDEFDTHDIDVFSSEPTQIVSMTPGRFLAMQSHSTLDRSSSDQSTGSLLYCKTPNTGTGRPIHHSGGVSGVLGNSALGKSSSLIFPTGVDSAAAMDRGKVDAESSNLKLTKINLRLDQCDALRFPFKKKLLLDKLNLSCSDIPMKDLCGTSLGNSLYKLSLSGNRLGSIPPKLVLSLPSLRTLDLSQCELYQLPEQFNLPKLTRLNLSNNRFTEFPDENMLEGLPELQELNMYGNNVSVILVPTNPKILCKLEILDMGYNNVSWLPDELDQLKSLRTLKVMNNLVSKVPMRICDMDLKVIDVSSNPVTEPPFETCERGICSMRRYWHCIRAEEQSTKKTLAEAHKKVSQKPKKGYGSFMGLKMRSSNLSGRKASASDLSSSTFSVANSAATESPLLRSQHRPVSVASLPKDESGVVKHAVSDSILSMPKSPEIVPSTPHFESKSNRSDSVASMEEVVTEESPFYEEISHDQVSVNDTLKVIFVGMALVGKTSMIKRLIEGKDTVIPTLDERTIGVDIYDWEPKVDKRFEHIDSHIEIRDEALREACGDVEVKFSVWDFAGQHVYHATHELFFSNRALYVLVWDMGATNPATSRKKVRGVSSDTGAFRLDDSSEEGESDNEADLALEEEERRADRALEHDIDEKVQFWIDCIQSTCPGAAILPVASFDDAFCEANGGVNEAKRRCKLLRQRVLKHEERRINGIEARLQELREQNRAGDTAAKRLRKLLCPFTRPKLIFGDDDDSVVRVSGTKYTGFDRLTEKIIGIATGKDLSGRRYPLFLGHIGARIPRMRLEVRDAVREMRGRFKVVEWGFFVNALRDRGLTNVEDISDALHFLTNVGELSFFGAVMLGTERIDNRNSADDLPKRSGESGQPTEYFDDDDDIDEEEGILSMDDTSITAPSTADGSLSTVEDFMSCGLSQFVFLNPRWLVAAVACILRHDLDNEIKETRRLAAVGKQINLPRTASFYDGHLSCPVITADDARLLWQNKRITKKAAERAQEYSNNSSVTPFDFLQLLLIRFGVFVPIDLSIEKALFGGKEYHQLVRDTYYSPDTSLPELPIAVETSDMSQNVSKAEFFFLPSLLGPCEPSDAWSYKCADAWKTVICHSILFPDGVPPGLMERLTASVLSSIYAVSNLTNDNSANFEGQRMATCEGQLSVKELLCWRAAFYIKIGMHNVNADGASKESIVEIFTHLAGKDSHLCVGSDYMGVGMRRLITSGRGQVGDGGRKIWKGGYLLVCKCIQRVMLEYEGLEFEKDGFCPECLAKKAVSEASSWESSAIRAAVASSEEMLRCQHGHRVDIRLVAGPSNVSERTQAHLTATGAAIENASVPVQNLLGAVVVVGLWDGKSRKVVRVGSGFIVDKKRGLIVTAAHTLINIRGEKQYPFGENYYGLRSGKVVIGVIPKDQESDGKDMAVFRFFAQIVSKDPSFDRGECHLDACVLRITTRMENDIGGDGEGCGDQPEILLLNDQKAMKLQQLSTLKLTEKCELEEQVRIVGYNQGGEGLLGPGEHLNRYVDFAKGYVCMKFIHEQSPSGRRTELFKPREEIVVICPTIGGHSGGPCVNQQGEVVGILSRADPAESQRCYLVPASEIKVLVNRAKKQL